MPIILKSEIIETETTREGWTKTTFADHKTIGTSVLVVQRWSFEPLAIGPEQKHGDTDQLLYVISGNGTTRVNGKSLPLEKETLLWLEQDDVYQFFCWRKWFRSTPGLRAGGVSKTCN